MPKELLKKYVVIYRSQEHYEVLGYVRAHNIEEAIKLAKEELWGEAKYYEVTQASIGELRDEREINFSQD